MAATSLKLISGVYTEDENTTQPVKVTGTGAPANGDDLSTNVVKYPLFSEYLDTTNATMYFRKAVTGVAADWKLTSA